jgi:WD40 repeat protein
MAKIDRDDSNLGRRLQDHYQQRYEQPPDPTVIWVRLLPHLDRQEESLHGLVQRAKWLPDFIGRYLARQKAALKYLHEEHTFMQDEVYIGRVTTYKPRVTTQNKQPLRRRILHIAEASIAAVLVAGMLVAWFVVTRAQSGQGAQPAPIFSYTGQPGENVYNLAWTFDNHYLSFMMCKQVPSGAGCRYLVWNAATGKVKQTLTLGSAAAPSGSSGDGTIGSPDGRYALIESYDASKQTATLTLVNILTGQVTQIYQGDHFLSFPAAAFSNNSALIAFAGDDGHIYVWNILASRLTLRSDPSGVTVTPQMSVQIGWSTDDTRILTAYSFQSGGFTRLQEWDAQTGHRLADIVPTPTMSPPATFTTIPGFSPDGQRVLMVNTQTGTIEERDSSTLKVLHTFGISSQRPDGSYNAYWVANGARILWTEGSQIYLSNSTTGQLITSFPSHGAILPDAQEQQYIAIAQTNKQLTIWDALTGKRVQTLPLPGSEGVDWLLGSNRYLAISEEGTSQRTWRIYDVLTGQLIASYPDGPAALSWDGRYLAIDKSQSNPQTEVVCDAHNQHCTSLTTSTLQVLAIR